ncbi:hypothetical protein HII13_002576 [Brettanomyces bruxellensis]|nr:hypothetical protein HII13_002576 [Brettanomyces bruxellensis]
MKTNRPKLKKSAVFPLKPREEIDFTEYYDNLDVDQQLEVKIIRNLKNGTQQHGKHQDKQVGEEVAQESDGLYDKMYNDSSLVYYRQDKRQRDKAILGRLKHPKFKRVQLEAVGSASSSADPDSGIPITNRKYHKYGYNDSSSKRVGQRGLTAYKRANESDYGLITGRLRKDEKLRVLYDMDNQDSLYVDYVNRQRAENGLKEISNEFFELVMTFIEMQFFFIEQLLPPSVANEDALSKKLAAKCSMYGSDDGIGVSPEEDQCCAICNRNDCDASNAIVFCDGCNIAVHQECYGIPFIPEGPWLCRRCLISRDHTQRCLFCPSTTGAFKQTDDGHWAHNICTLWIGEVYFANPTYMEPIEGIQNIPKGRWKLTCFICRRKVGACIQCSKHNCFVAYHATCAKRAGLYMEMKEGVKGALDHPLSLISYCDRHTPGSWACSHDTALGIEKTRLFYSRSNVSKLNKQARYENYVPVSTEKFRELQESKSRLFKWKTNRGSPVVPHAVVERMESYLKRERLLPDGSEDLLANICKYWTLKREQSKIPLIRRPDPINYGSMTLDDVQDRLGVLDMIKKDVQKLGEISERVSERSVQTSRLNSTLVQESEAFYLPRLFAIETVGSAFLHSDKYGVLDTILTDNEGVIDGKQLRYKIENGGYDSVEELIDDIEQLAGYVLSTYSRNSGPYKLFKLHWGKMKRQKYQMARNFEWLCEEGEQGLREAYGCFERNGLAVCEVPKHADGGEGDEKKGRGEKKGRDEKLKKKEREDDRKDLRPFGNSISDRLR